MYIEDLALPKQIKVGGFVCKVINDYEFGTEDQLIGQYEPVGREIRLASKILTSEGEVVILDVATRWATFLHELLHAMEVLTGHCLINGRYIGEKSEETEERVIEVMSEALFTVFRDNPDLCDAIAGIRGLLIRERIVD